MTQAKIIGQYASAEIENDFNENTWNRYDSVTAYLRSSEKQQLLTDEESAKLGYEIQKSTRTIRKLILSTPYFAEKVLETLKTHSFNSFIHNQIQRHSTEIITFLDQIKVGYTAQDSKLISSSRVGLYKIMRKINLKMDFVESVAEELSINLEKNGEKIENQTLETMTDTKNRLEKVRECFESYHESKNELVTRNLGLVISMAKKYNRRGFDFLDLIARGNTFLVKAAEGFKPIKGNKFSTYAHYCIHGGLVDELTDKPLEETILDAPRYSEDDTGETWKAKIPDENTPSAREDVANKELIEQVQKAYSQVSKKLNKTERYVIIHSFGLNGLEPRSIEDIANGLGVTRQAVSIRRQRTLKKLRWEFLKLKDAI